MRCVVNSQLKSRARPIEAELHRRASEARDNSRLEVHLQVDDEIKLASGECAANVGKRAQPFRPVEDHDLVDRTMTATRLAGQVAAPR